MDKWDRKESCISPYHNPPSHMVVKDGEEFVYRCPACGEETVIRGNKVIW